MTPELWLPITGFEGRYEISNMGRVRSVGRAVYSAIHPSGYRMTKGFVLKACTWGAQYPGIVMVAEDMSRRRRMVHQLVAEAFVPNPHGLKQINHLDADTFNARFDNLEWTDQSENVRHAYRLGNRKVGREHHFANLPRDSAGRCLKKSGQA